MAMAALAAGFATTAATRTPVHAAARWQPGNHEPWQWMISGTFDPNNSSQLRGGAADQPTVYDIDGFLNTAATVQTLHASGYHVICYIEAGSWTDYRPDAGQFPSSIIGKQIGGFSDKWTDIRSPLLRPIIEARIQMCAQKGFDAVEPDLEDGYSNNTGFPLTASDQIVFNTWVAQTVHNNGMSVLLKGDPEQAAQLAPTVDFFLNEECNAYNECNLYPAVAAGGKTVLNAEYNGKCPTSAFALANLDSTLFKVDLNGPRTPCANSKGGTTVAVPPPTAVTTTTTPTTTAAPKTTTTVPAVRGPSTTTTTTSVVPRRRHKHSLDTRFGPM
ncbi:MAG: endo alpha-1,4 polygalactosaminidase [Ilumatobacteraceae bacterium]